MENSKAVEIRICNQAKNAVVICRTREMFRTKVVMRDGKDVSGEKALYSAVEFAPATLSSWTVLKPGDELTFRIGLILNNEHVVLSDIAKIKVKYTFVDPAGVFKLFRDQYGTESQKQVRYRSEIYADEGISVVDTFECEWHK